MKIQDIIDLVPSDIKEGGIVERKWKGGKLVQEVRKQTSWKPNAADLDTLFVQCTCGNEFELPRDCLMFLNDMICGQCCVKGNIQVK